MGRIETTNPVDLNLALRGHTSMKEIMAGNASKFLPKAKLMPTHPLSNAFAKLEKNSIQVWKLSQLRKGVPGNFN
jgi:hypothetical protein